MKQTHTGMIALTTVLIIGALLLVMGIGIATRTMIAQNITLDQEQSTQALSLATSCAEYALVKLSESHMYTGNETVFFGTESCILLPIEIPDPLGRTIKAQASYQGYTKRVLVQITSIHPPLEIGSWQEVSSF